MCVCLLSCWLNVLCGGPWSAEATAVVDTLSHSVVRIEQPALKRPPPLQSVPLSAASRTHHPPTAWQPTAGLQTKNELELRYVYLLLCGVYLWSGGTVSLFLEDNYCPWFLCFWKITTALE